MSNPLRRWDTPRDACRHLRQSDDTRNHPTGEPDQIKHTGQPMGCPVCFIQYGKRYFGRFFISLLSLADSATGTGRFIAITSMEMRLARSTRDFISG